MGTCESCGDKFRRQATIIDGLTEEQMKVLNRKRLLYCECCARELALGKITKLGPLGHDAGGGQRVIRGWNSLG